MNNKISASLWAVIGTALFMIAVRIIHEPDPIYFLDAVLIAIYVAVGIACEYFAVKDWNDEP